jgi:hypothetical protein
MPAMAFAFAGGEHVAHCLTDEPAAAAPVSAHRHADGAMHRHADGTLHRHHGTADHDHGDHRAAPSHADDPAVPASPAGDAQHHGTSCCGLFSVVAIADDLALGFGALALASPAVAPLPDALTGRGPDRIIRPPIA